MPSKLTLKTDLSKCVKDFDTKYAHNMIRATPCKGGAWLAATNGKIAAVAEVEGNLDAPCLIPPKVCKPDTLRGEPGNWEHQKGKNVTVCREHIDGGVFAPVEEVLKDGVKGKPLAVRLDARLFADLAKAITEGATAGYVTLLIRDATHGVAVLGSAGIGMIMPIDIGEDFDPVASYRGHAERYSAAVAAAEA